MKYLKLFLMAVVIFGLSACSGSVSFSPEKCKALTEKIKNHEELTESDYSEMIDQVGAAAKALSDKKKELDGNTEGLEEFGKSQEARDMLGTVLGFGIYLEANKSKLSPENQEKLRKVSEEMKNLDADK